MIRTIWTRYHRWLSYGFFGVFTTATNIAAYLFFYQIIGWANMLSVSLAWLVAVTFAFFTNKVWVFGSRRFTLNLIMKEGIRFYGSRLFTGMLDVLFMYVGIDIFAGNPAVWKAASDIIMAIINYVASRYWIFLHSGEAE